QSDVPLGTLQNLGLVSGRTVRLRHATRRRRAVHLQPAEQIDIFARPLYDPVRLHAVTAGQCEAVLISDAETNLEQSPVEGVHYAARSRSRANLATHSRRTRTCRINSGQTRASSLAFRKALRSCSRPSWMTCSYITRSAAGSDRL